MAVNYAFGSCSGELETLNLPKTTLELLQASCAPGTWKQDHAVTKQWFAFCTTNHVIKPHKPSIAQVLQFLSELFDKGSSYISINTARSALSIILHSIDGEKVGCHPLVVRLLKGVSRRRPPQSKYVTTWDPAKVLNLFDSWEESDHLSLEKLSLKLVGLLALASGQRAQTLVSIKVDNIVINNDVQIIISDRLKTTKPGRITELLFSQYPTKKLCVKNTLEEYLKRTKIHRTSDRKQLLLSFRNPHNQITSQTLAKWLKRVLEMASINTNEFSAHSFRHASTSKALRSGVPIDSIFKAAGWSSNSKMFARFYNRPVVDNKNSFMSGVLKM
ncbi:Tyrosine recombinase XerC [Orchesella cincta]|uniref:Tyrosine recombinase XerC n=1 Tax=Orchesella cincta TaxID=48709 RepID=A0A1D2MLS4_ORCCI|nr:Tyrosine recombinase XerC [Orchesella cincta]